MHTITFSSFKGGTSKTSTALHLGSCLAKLHKKKVLLVDFDPQANLSIGLGVGPDSENTIVAVLQDQKTLNEVIVETCVPGLFLVPANAYLDGIEKMLPLANNPYSQEKLREVLETVKGDYDFCFIDTPPSLGWLTQSAFFASQHNLVCAIPEAYSVLALRRLKDFQDSIRKRHTIDVLGVLLSFWDERGAVNQTFLDEIDSSFPGKTFESKIRRDMAVSRAVLKGEPVIITDPNSRAALDYQSLTRELLARFGLSNSSAQDKKFRKQKFATEI